MERIRHPAQHGKNYAAPSCLQIKTPPPHASQQICGGDAALAFASRNLYLVPYSVGGGLAVNRRRFSASVTTKWNSKQRLSYIDYLSNSTVDPGTYEYLAPALRIDLDASFHLTQNASLFVNGRNINHLVSIVQRYSPATPALAKNYRRQAYEPVWTAGFKAKF